MEKLKNSLVIASRMENRLLKSKKTSIEKVGQDLLVVRKGVTYRRSGDKCWSDIEGQIYPMTHSMWVNVLLQCMANSIRKNFGARWGTNKEEKE